MTSQEKIMELLKEGYNLTEISEYLMKNNYKPNSISSVEKYLYKLKKEYKAKTMFQLAFLMYR